MKNKRKIDKIIDNLFNVTLICIFVFVSVFLFQNEIAISYAINGSNGVFSNTLQVYALNVGQASANLIILPNNISMIIDTGSTGSEMQFVDEVEYIFNQNSIKQVDYLILTHSDEDHVGGVKALMEKFDVKRVFRPKILSNSSLEIENESTYLKVDTESYSQAISAIYTEKDCAVEFVSNKNLVIYDAYITIWAADDEFNDSPNYFSPFVRIEFKNKNFLFTGDATKTRESEFISKYNLSGQTFEIDFLYVAHHGASSSSTEEFLQTIKPKYAIISSGDALHPTIAVTERLENCGVSEILMTKSDNTIIVTVNENGIYGIWKNPFVLETPAIVTLFGIFVFMFINFTSREKTNISKFMYKH